MKLVFVTPGHAPFTPKRSDLQILIDSKFFSDRKNHKKTMLKYRKTDIRNANHTKTDKYMSPASLLFNISN